MRLLRTGGSLKENGGVRAKLVDYLAARSARRARDAVVVGDSNRLNLNLWAELRDCGKDRGSLCTIGHSVGCIFDIATRKHLSVREQDGSPHVKIRIGSMRILHHFDCRLFKLLPHAA